jgi:hypothetical protein
VLEAPRAAVTPEFKAQIQLSAIVIRDTACGAGNRDGLNLIGWKLMGVLNTTGSRICLRSGCLVIGLGFTGLASLPAHADGFEGPNFRKGMWHFVRTLEIVLHTKSRQRLLNQEVTRCVDPTEAMKLTFSPSTVGSCVSAKPERVDNIYTFANRCDYMGPVTTTIIVESAEAYTEVNLSSVGELPKRDSVAAWRVGDCEDTRKSDGSLSQ